MAEPHRSRCRLCRRGAGEFDDAGCCPKCSQGDTRKYVVHPLPASFGSSRFPAHKKGDTSCPTCSHESDLQAQLQQAQEERGIEQQGRQGAERQRDKAIERGIGVYEYGLYLISLTRLAEASRWLIGTRLRTERERAEAAEALLEAAWLQSGHPHFQTWYKSLTPTPRGEGE